MILLRRNSWRDVQVVQEGRIRISVISDISIDTGFEPTHPGVTGAGLYLSTLA
jgi:hypothetical protein